MIPAPKAIFPFLCAIKITVDSQSFHVSAQAWWGDKT